MAAADPASGCSRAKQAGLAHAHWGQSQIPKSIRPAVMNVLTGQAWVQSREWATATPTTTACRSSTQGHHAAAVLGISKPKANYCCHRQEQKRSLHTPWGSPLAATSSTCFWQLLLWCVCAGQAVTPTHKTYSSSSAEPQLIQTIKLLLHSRQLHAATRSFQAPMHL